MVTAYPKAMSCMMGTRNMIPLILLSLKTWMNSLTTICFTRSYTTSPLFHHLLQLHVRQREKERAESQEQGCIEEKETYRVSFQKNVFQHPHEVSRRNHVG